MTFEETAKAMLSDDWRERVLAEYWQLEVRIDRLECMLNKWHMGKLKFIPNTPYRILVAQLAAMEAYRAILAERIEIEGINRDLSGTPSA